MFKKAFIEVIAILLISLFTYAAVSKLMTYTNFKFQLKRSPYLTNIAGFVSFLLPTIEIAISVLLVKRNTRLFGFYGAFFLMCLFTGYIYIMLNYSPYLPCTCGGVLSSMSWNQHLYFNICFMVLSLVGILLMAKQNYETYYPIPPTD